MIIPLGRNRESALFIVWQANTLEFMYGLFDTKKGVWTPLEPIPDTPATSKYSVTGSLSAKSSKMEVPPGIPTMGTLLKYMDNTMIPLKRFMYTFEHLMERVGSLRDWYLIR